MTADLCERCSDGACGFCAWGFPAVPAPTDPCHTTVEHGPTDVACPSCGGRTELVEVTTLGVVEAFRACLDGDDRCDWWTPDNPEAGG